MTIIRASYSPPDGTPVIGISAPGHNGDMLWGLPAARQLAARHGCQADFWTSRVCQTAADLLQAQSFVRNVVIDPNQRVEAGHGAGVQPWHMPNMEGPGHGYLAHYHLGFRQGPIGPIPDYLLALYDLPRPVQLPWQLDLPPGYEGSPLPAENFVALATKGKADLPFLPLFRDFVRRVPYPIVEVGYPGQAIAGDLGATDCTRWGFVEMAYIISRCRWFVGTLSAPLVVASAFNCIKVALHDGQRWDMRHVVQSPLHHYVTTAEALLECVR